MGKGRKKKGGKVKGAEENDNVHEKQSAGDQGEEQPKLSRKQKRMLKLQKKEQAQQKGAENESQNDLKEDQQEPQIQPSNTKSAFALMESDEDQDSEQEQDVPKAKSKKQGFSALGISDSEDEDQQVVVDKKSKKKQKSKGEKKLESNGDEEVKEVINDEEESQVSKARQGFAALGISDCEEEGEEQEEVVDKKSKKKKQKGAEEEGVNGGQVEVDDVVLEEDKKKGKKKKKRKEKQAERDDSSQMSSVQDDENLEEEPKEKKSKKSKKKKISNKEKRKLKMSMEAEEREKQLKEMGHKETDFAVSATANTMTEEAWENATDIDIPQFTISAFGKTLFKDASLKITAGRRYGLVGPNGKGKSTLLKQIARKELKIPPRIDVLYVEQEVTADDTPAVEMVLRADKTRTKLLEEEKELMKKLDDSEDLELAELNELQERLEAISQELRSSGSDSAEARALSLLHGLGFTPEMQRAATKTFSGGWRMRVSIARALFIQPTLLLLDEPTNHLDLNAVIWLDDYLQKWKSTLLVVSHDQDFLDSVCTDIIHLDDQQLFFYRGNYSVFKVQQVKHMEKMKKAWEKQEKELRALRKKGKSNKKAVEMQAKKKSRETGGAKGRKGQKNGSQQTNEAGSLAERQLLRRPKEYEVKFTFPDPTELAPPIIQVDDVAFHYPDSPILFERLSFGVDMESRITIVGPNGVGKSTLLKVMTKELDPTSGEVTINRHLRIARYHQHFVDVLPFDESPIEFLQRKHDISYQEGRNRLGKFGLEGTAHTIKMLNLSGGQKSRVVFTSLTFQEPHMLILDEPTNNLDIESIDALSDAINEFEGGVILVSHDARLITTTDMRLWICENKTVEEMPGGFDAYREEILEALAKQEEVEKQRQEERLAQKEKERKVRLARLEARKLAKEGKK